MLSNLAAVIEKETGFRASDVTPETRIEDFVKDSLEFASLVMALKAEFGELPIDKITAAETVEDLLLLCPRTAENAS